MFRKPQSRDVGRARGLTLRKNPRNKCGAVYRPIVAAAAFQAARPYGYNVMLASDGEQRSLLRPRGGRSICKPVYPSRGADDRRRCPARMGPNAAKTDWRKTD